MAPPQHIAERLCLSGKAAFHFPGGSASAIHVEEWPLDILRRLTVSRRLTALCGGKAEGAYSPDATVVMRKES